MQVRSDSGWVFACYLTLFILLSWAAVHLPFIQSIDDQVHAMTVHLQSPYWLRLNAVLTWLGAGLVLVGGGILVMLYLFWKGAVRIGAWYFLSLSMGLQSNAALKVFFSRERPNHFGYGMDLLSFSYPSGHVAGITIFCLLTWALIQSRGWVGATRSGWWIGVLLPIVIVALSRVFLGVHWFSDVLGGWLWGLVWVGMSRQLVSFRDATAASTGVR